jgi:hypothetical protein
MRIACGLRFLPYLVLEDKSAVPIHNRREEERETYQLVAEQLRLLGEDVFADDYGVWFADWQSIYLSIRFLWIDRAGGEEVNWLARLELNFRYNMLMPDTEVPTRAIGLGPTPTEALRNAVQNWITGIAPALISHIYGILKHGAEYSPNGHHLGIEGWNCISGPYVLHGAAEIKKTAEGLLHRQALISPVREALERRLQNLTGMHSVSLFRATSGSDIYGEVLIDNEADDDAGAMLKELHLPAEPHRTGFISARQFLLCVRPSE